MLCRFRGEVMGWEVTGFQTAHTQRRMSQKSNKTIIRGETSVESEMRSWAIVVMASVGIMRLIASWLKGAESKPSPI
jgi:hypothetical protein